MKLMLKHASGKVMLQDLSRFKMVISREMLHSLREDVMMSFHYSRPLRCHQDASHGLRDSYSPASLHMCHMPFTSPPRYHQASQTRRLRCRRHIAWPQSQKHMNKFSNGPLISGQKQSPGNPGITSVASLFTSLFPL